MRGLAICAITFAACTQNVQPIALQSIDITNIIRSGSPFHVRGVGLSGATVTMQFADRLIDVHLHNATQDANGETADGTLPEIELPDQTQLSQACLTAPTFGNWQRCAAVSAVWQKVPQASAAPITATTIALGQWLDLPCKDALLPTEGQTWLQTADDQTVPTQVTWQKGQRQVRFLASTSWLGVQPGLQKRQMRLVLQTHGQTVQSPWMPLEFTLQPPQLTALPGVLRRGDRLPLQLSGVPTDGGAQLLWRGVWQTQGGGHTALVDLALPLGTEALLPSAWQLSQIPVNATQFDGDVRLRLQAHGATWLGAGLGVSWPLLPTIQHVQVLMEQNFVAGLTRLGLQAHAAAVRARTVAILAQHFAQFSLEVSLLPPDNTLEYLIVTVLDRDPNGQHLFGADSSSGKDVGNLVLNEHLLGFDPTAAAAGEIAYGGVFIGEFIGFSRRLHPNSAQSSTDFDEIFGPFAEILGGVPAASAQMPKLAIETLAQLIAHTAAHEIGHALGLAAGTTAYHHAGDNPGWIMDTGTARDFAERAALPAAQNQTWGPVDTAYLNMILSKP